MVLVFTNKSFLKYSALSFGFYYLYYYFCPNQLICELSNVKL